MGLLIDRFNSKWAPTAEGCWRWLDALNSAGYGQISTGDGGRVLAHRFAYEALVGSIPAGLTIDHLCRNRWCVNPAHLEPVSRGENVLRGESPSALHARQTTCLRGHPLAGVGADVLIDSLGRRVCRVCRRERKRARRWGS